MKSWKNSGGIFDLPNRIIKIEALEKKTTESGFWNNNQKAQAISKEISVNKKWVETHEKYVSELETIEELMTMIDDDFSSDAKELAATFEELTESIDKFEFTSFLSGPDDHRDTIVTIHPGAGGTESQDWADMLFRMYNRWVERKEFTSELIDLQPGDEAGIKSAAFKVKGEFAHGFLKAESGVHRLVRISPFDANSRRHTSFASIHVYPVVEDNIEIEIKDDDIRIDTFRASGAGGQHVNKTSSAIRITHLPTNIVVSCQSQRSQHRNKEAAMSVLKSRLYQIKKDEEAAKRNKSDKTKKKIEWGSQIRSYVFHPYNMVKDHRTSVETSNIQAVMDGDIDKFIDAFLSDPDLKE